MISLPRIVGSSAVSTNVTQDRRVSNGLCPSAVVGVVVVALMSGPPDIAQLLYALPMCFASAFEAELPTV